jgi:hydroxymethylpyrimidine/phosphomethylpyrimidine kinase
MQADLKTFAAAGAYGMGALTVATDCTTRSGVNEVRALEPAFVRHQIDRVAGDVAPAGVKTGMLFSQAIIRTVARAAREHGWANDAQTPFVVDPVMTTRAGERLLSDGAEGAMREALLPLAMVATPSLPEAERLTGRDVRSRQAMRQAAEAILDLGAEAVVVTGGHLGAGEPAVDLLLDADGKAWLEAERVPRTVRGAGDAFSAALAAGLAEGHALREAAERAKTYVTGAIRHAPERGGESAGRPLWHEWQRFVEEGSNAAAPAGT